MQVHGACVAGCYDASGVDDVAVADDNVAGGVRGELVACLEDCFRRAGWGHKAELTDGWPAWVSLTVASVLILLSGLFGGLTLGLLSLDLVGLRILEKAGEPKEQRYAERIIPVRSKGNRLLCTLLLGNVVVNSALSIILADLTSGLVGLLVSSSVILIFGEILPQSVCSRYGLMIGAYSIWIVQICMLIFFPITWPMSSLLDWMLGRDVGTMYSQAELKRLIEIHVKDPNAQHESGLTEDDEKLLIGSLEYKAKKVMDVMTNLDQIYMLEKSTKLNFENLCEIHKSGYSRIPVYEGKQHNITGILFVKDLILVDPDDEIELSRIMSFRGHGVGRVYEDVTLDKVMKKFLSSSGHLLIAHKQCSKSISSLPGMDEPTGDTEVTGLITLEDVLEEVLQDEIIDETDRIENATFSASSGSTIENSKQRSFEGGHEMSTFLQFFDHKLHMEKLSEPELKAISSFLISNVEEFHVFEKFEKSLICLIQDADIIDADDPNGRYTPPKNEPLKSQLLWNDSPDDEELLLYQQKVPSPYFTLVLQGKVIIRTSMEDFMLELGPWSHLGNKALSQQCYVPDFDAQGVAPCRLLRVHRNCYETALGSSTQRRSSGRQQNTLANRQNQSSREIQDVQSNRLKSRTNRAEYISAKTPSTPHKPNLPDSEEFNMIEMGESRPMMGGSSADANQGDESDSLLKATSTMATGNRTSTSGEVSNRSSFGAFFRNLGWAQGSGSGFYWPLSDDSVA